MRKMIYLQYDKKPNLKMKMRIFLVNIPSKIIGFFLTPYYILKYKYYVMTNKETKIGHDYWKSLGYKPNGVDCFECEPHECDNFQKLLNEL